MLRSKTYLKLGFLSTAVLFSYTATPSAMAFSVPPLQNTSVIYANSMTTLVANNEHDERAASAQRFISGLAKQGIGFLEDTSLTEDQRAEKFQVFLRDNFDMKTIGRFALGRYWRTSSKDQKKEYLDLFEQMIVTVYSRRFGDYKGQEFMVTKARPDGKYDAIVSSKIVPENGPEIDLDWRVREKDSGVLKVIDIMVEGVSMSLTQRSDFASVIQRGGGDVNVLLSHLRLD